MKPLIEKYRSYLSVTDQTTVISLSEGNTPLLFAPRLSKETGAKIFLKLEGLNPTGSFKDRGMTMAVSKAVEGGAKAIVCASTGNTSASAAAYAARAGLRCIVLIPEGKVAQGKLAQVSLTGAEVIQLDGNFDEALKLVRELSDKHPIELVNSVNPYRIEGQTTGAFEIVDALGSAPDYHALPVGNAGNITAYWRGYQLYNQEKNSGLPKMIGFQAAGAAPIVLGKPVANPETVATAIRIGNPASWKTAEKARDESGGRIDSVTDEEILEAYRMLCSYEGVFCEPASASSLAGVLKMVRQGYQFDGKKVVCILTGNGLKDPTTAISFSKDPVRCSASFDALVDLVGAS